MLAALSCSNGHSASAIVLFLVIIYRPFNPYTQTMPRLCRLRICIHEYTIPLFSCINYTNGGLFHPPNLLYAMLALLLGLHSAYHTKPANDTGRQTVFSCNLETQKDEGTR